MKTKKGLTFHCIVIFALINSLLSCSDLDSNKKVFEERKNTITQDTIKISDSVFLLVIKNRNSLSIRTHDKNNNISVVEFYKNGSLKKIQNQQGSKMIKQNDGTLYEAHNIQILELDNNGFVEHYCLTRNFDLVDEKIFSDSIGGTVSK